MLLKFAYSAYGFGFRVSGLGCQRATKNRLKYTVKLGPQTQTVGTALMEHAEIVSKAIKSPRNPDKKPS